MMWQISFWDNGVCVEFLVKLFKHMALIPFPSNCNRAVELDMFGQGESKHKFSTSDNVKEYEKIRRLLKSITLQTLQRAKAMDPDFKKKLFDDAELGEIPIDKILRETLGLTMGHLWTLIHMHVGAPCRMKDLDALAKAFDRRNGGTYKIHHTRDGENRCNLAWFKKKQNRQADSLLKGVLKYKECMVRDKWNLPSMKLLYLGIENSAHLWTAGKEVPANVWEDDDSILGELGIVPVDQDHDIDKVRCSVCKKVEGEKKTLLLCACKCVQYCNRTCQVSRLMHAEHDTYCGPFQPYQIYRTVPFHHRKKTGKCTVGFANGEWDLLM